jgi:hypothetical protein
MVISGYQLCRYLGKKTMLQLPPTEVKTAGFPPPFGSWLSKPDQAKHHERGGP